jgi:predicted DNA-binding transcriptional regulator AlpA
MELDAYSIPQFCAAHGISRAMFYKILNDGTGPRVMKVGSRTMVSREAATRWRREREEASVTEAA